MTMKRGVTGHFSQRPFAKRCCIAETIAQHIFVDFIRVVPQLHFQASEKGGLGILPFCLEGVSQNCAISLCMM